MRGLLGSKRIAAAAILVGAVAIGLSDLVAAQQNGQRQRTPAAKAQQKPSPAKAGAAGKPAAEQAQAQTAGKGEDETASAGRDSDDRAAIERQLAEATAAITDHGLAVTYATIGLIVVSASLWLMVFLQARDLKAAVRAVQDSAAGARSAGEAMQRALVLTQRATVIVGEPRAVWLRDAAGRLVGCRLLVTWHNVGTTPTRNMIAAVAGLATDRPPSQTSAFPKADARQQPAVVGPNAAINSAYVNLPIGLVGDILERKAYYLFAGWAEYNDVFDHTPRHRVEFCYWVEFEGQPEGEKLETRFHIHGKHNRHCESGLDSQTLVDGKGANSGVPPRLASAQETAGSMAAQL